jgi:hypothetical protein
MSNIHVGETLEMEKGLWAEISSGIQIFLICIFMKYVNITVVIRIAAGSELELASSFVEFAAI